MNTHLQLWVAVFLLMDGFLLLLRPLYDGSIDLVAGRPWIPVALGLVSLLLALTIFGRMKEES